MSELEKQEETGFIRVGLVKVRYEIGGMSKFECR